MWRTIHAEWYAWRVNKTTLYLPDELRRSLKDVARRTGRREAEVVREALGIYLAQQAPPQPRSLGAGEDPDLAGRDSEHWLQDRWSGNGPAVG